MPLRKNEIRTAAIALAAAIACCAAFAVYTALEPQREQEFHQNTDHTYALNETIAADSPRDEADEFEGAPYSAGFDFDGTMTITLTDAHLGGLPDDPDNIIYIPSDTSYIDTYLTFVIRIENVDAVAKYYQEADKKYWFNISGIVNPRSTMSDFCYFDGTAAGATEKEGLSFELHPGEEATYTVSVIVDKDALPDDGCIDLALGMGNSDKYRISTGLSVADIPQEGGES